MIPIGLRRGQHDHRRRGPAVRHRGAEARDPRRVVRGAVEAIAMSEPEAGLGRRQPLAAVPSASTASYVINGQKTWITGATPPSTSCSCAGQQDRRQARGAVDDLGPGRRRGGRGPRDRDDGRPRGQRHLLHRLPRARRAADRRPRTRAGAADGRAQPRAADHRRPGARDGQRAFDDALAYVKERKQFGRPIGTFQALKHRIADLATELEATGCSSTTSPREADARPGGAAAARGVDGEAEDHRAAKRVALEGMQMMGGYGYATEYDMERQVRPRS